ncbi:hypothetical protein J0895_14315 [Phormidium pseudopriestleyi FRX01]|uniref:MerC domain-containing protein n=1 Tax=Phormidium pseudopriestleyi FRX01 TaxID=1759528 RepID=A0ABS3FT80_9CYAN|nr:hypothetical protein [Phormidium pseudopriestleyi]MBO0350263.1 hypothetical protein [Phormidium pseudopriestleyi FRX01]
MSCFHHQRDQINYGHLETPAFVKFINNLGRIPLLAHHPACKYYHNHIIWIGNLPLCLGCLMMSCGIITGFLLIPHLGVLKTLPFFVLLSLGILLYVPAVLQIWIQKKFYKIIARFCLGVSVVFLCYAGLWLTPNSTIGWILKFGFITVFYGVWHLTLKMRSQYSKSPCTSCPEGRFPLCSYTTHRISKLAPQYFSESDGNNQEADEFVTALQSVYSQPKNDTI